MKNLIEYYYNLDIDSIRMIDNNYYFIQENVNYIFMYLDINKYDIDKIFKFNMYLKNISYLFDDIIINKENNIVTSYEHKHFMLVRINITNNKMIKFKDILYFMIPIMNKELIMNYNNFNWADLWKNKIDNLENYTKQLDNQDHHINILINYYIGMGENAINYIENAFDSLKHNPIKLTISHRRINYNDTWIDLYNPINLIIDHVSRDVGEYFKSLFLNKKYSIDQLEKYIDKLNFNDFDFRCLFSRLLFPSYFFDMYEQYLDKKIKKKDLLNISNRIKEYEQFLKQIYLIIIKKYKIPEIKWIKKVDI